VFKIDRARFEEAIADRFGAAAVLVERHETDSAIDVVAQVNRPGEPEFQIFHFRDGGAISTDGTAERAVEVMQWVRSLFPANPGAQIWAVDEMYNGHVELIPGMTNEQIESGWIDHAENRSE
jgi:hypothetical protein